MYVLHAAAICSHEDVRLYGGFSRYSGIAEVCINGVWANICHQNWDAIDTNVFCGQLLGRNRTNFGMIATICKSITQLQYS